MGELASAFAAAEGRDQALLVLIASIVALFALAISFAAYAVYLRLRTDARERRWQALAARWEEPVLAALLDPEASAAAHRAVDQPDRLRFVRFALEYSRRVRGEERATLKELAAPYLPLVAERVWSPRPEVRARAIQTLGELGLPRYAPEVVAALDDASPLVAMVAARALCTPEHPEYGRAVLRRMPRFEGWSRGFMASMLAGVGAEAAPALRDVLGDGAAAPASRAVAGEALRLLKDLESADVAARVAAEVDDPELLAVVLRLLALVGGPEHVAVVRARCGSTEVAVRAAAAGALGSLGAEEDHPRLLGALADESAWVAIQAARGLVAGGARLLLEELRDSDHPRALLAAQVLLEEGGEA